VNSFSPPPSPHPGDSEPAPPPSLPSDPALWGEADIKALRVPVAAFSTRPRETPDERQPTIGHIGRYALKYQLGEGGLGTVYAAQDPLLSRLIAVKTLHVEIDESERAAFNAMFLNEARAAGGLNHAHIVTVFDAGVSDNRAYIAMELLKGRDLGQLRREGWRPTPTQAALIVRRVADPLGYAHSKGVIHRDVKPANIFMIGRTQPKVLDFGIARIAHRQHETLNRDADVAAGSPYYMAPEQARQEPMDRRADVFSLGVVLYELLTNEKPFRGANLDEITKAVLEHEPPLASSVDPSVPVALAEIAAKAMAKDPDHRHRSARAFSRELRHWLEESGSAGGDAEAAPAGASSNPRVLWAAAAAIGAVALGLLLWSPSGHRRSDAPVSTTGKPAPVSEPTPAPAPATATVATPAAQVPPLAAAPEAHAAPTAVTSTPAPAAVAATALKSAPKESAKERRAREARERDARLAAAAQNAAAPPPRGLVRIAVSPWGEVEVDGKPAGASPPLTELSLPEGRHQIVIRNTDLPPLSMVANVSADQPVTVKHKF